MDSVGPPEGEKDAATDRMKYAPKHGAVTYENLITYFNETNGRAFLQSMGKSFHCSLEWTMGIIVTFCVTGNLNNVSNEEI